MTFNWDYLLGQLLMVILSAAVAAVILTVLRLARVKRGALRVWLELPIIGAALWCLGMWSRELGYVKLLPLCMFPWTLAVALTFYWMAVWWPLRVAVLHRELKRGRVGIAALIAAPVMVLGAGYSLFVEPQWLEVEHQELVLDDIGTQTIRIAHVSDTQITDFGSRERAVVAAINEFDPHLIIFTGDYIAGPMGESETLPAFRDLLSQLRASHGIFGTTSDSDSERQRLAIFKGPLATYLLNKSTTVDIDGLRVRIGGLSHYAPRWSRMAGDATADELFVVACHSPDLAEATGEKTPLADLFLCGHTHGGQIQVPWFGPPLTMCKNTSRHVAAGGVFETATGMPFLVTRGVGMEADYAPRFRFNCRPHLFLLTLRGAATGDATR